MNSLVNDVPTVSGNQGIKKGALKIIDEFILFHRTLCQLGAENESHVCQQNIAEMRLEAWVVQGWEVQGCGSNFSSEKTSRFK